MKNYISRPLYIKRIEPFIDKSIIKVITGQRRIGKSYILLQISDIIKKNIPEANIIFGAVIDDKMTDEMRVTIIDTGFEPKRAKPATRNAVIQPEIAPIPKFKGPTLEIPEWMKRK